MSPAGRKPLSGVKKEDQIRVRLTADEKALIDAAAKLAEKPPTVWVRDVSLETAAAEIAASQDKKPAKKKR